MGWDIFHYTRLHKATSNLTPNPSRDGAPTASPGSPCRCLATLIIIRTLGSPLAPTHHGDSVVQEGLAEHDDEEGLVHVDLFKNSQHCHRVHSRDEAAEEQEIHQPGFHAWICWDRRMEMRQSILPRAPLSGQGKGQACPLSAPGVSSASLSSEASPRGCGAWLMRVVGLGHPLWWFLRAQKGSEDGLGQPGPAAPAEDREHGSEPAKLAKVGDKNSKDMSQPSAEQVPFVLHARWSCQNIAPKRWDPRQGRATGCKFRVPYILPPEFWGCGPCQAALSTHP